VPVIELGGGLDLFLEELEGSLVKLGVLKVEHLDGVFVASGIDSELDLGAEAFTESLAEHERVESLNL